MGQQPLLINPQGGLLLLLCLFVTATIHEFAHAYAADHLGDPTPREQGRVSLIPLDHIDLTRGIAMVLFSLFGIGFAWGKPVPVDSTKLKNPRRDDLRVASAGPAVNLAIALALAVVMETGYFHLGTASPWHKLINVAFQVNLITMLFNLVPLPPFDGARIVGDLLSEENEKAYLEFLRTRGWIFVLITLFVVANFVRIAAGDAQQFLGGRYERAPIRHAAPPAAHLQPAPPPPVPLPPTSDTTA